MNMIPIPDKRKAKVDEHTLEYATAGTGRPAIVFISGGGPAEMDSWGKVYPEAAHISTVFAYNRFGDGASDQVAEVQTGAKVVATLRALLASTCITPPVVLVGHSIGGLFANLYARRYPAEVAGVVLVDSSHPDQGPLMRDAGPVWGAINAVLGKIYAVVNPAKSSEIAAFEETADQVRNAGPFPDVPLAVLTACKRFTFMVPENTIRTLDEQQRSLATMAPKAKQVIAANSGHFVQNDEPAVVVRAIAEVVRAAREER